MKKVVVLAGFIAVLSLFSCSNKKEEKAEVVKFTVTNAALIDTSFTREYVSQI